MSGLAGIIAGHHPVGVYQWHNQMPAPEVGQRIEHAGWDFAWVDGWTHQDKDAFLDGVQEGLGFPDDFAHTFDAMADCLRDITAPTVVLWDGWGPLAREDEQAFKVALDIFTERVGEKPPFVVLLRGEGPPVSIPSLD